MGHFGHQGQRVRCSSSLSPPVSLSLSYLDCQHAAALNNLNRLCGGENNSMLDLFHLKKPMPAQPLGQPMLSLELPGQQRDCRC